MGAISFSIDENLVAFFVRQLPIKRFVETGAFKGDSLEIARRHFSECLSVEMSPELYERARARFASVGNVKLEQGASSAFLRRHCAEFSALPALFWLDAHWCTADSTSGKESQSPLLDELTAIHSLQADSVILIDDARLYLCAPPPPHDCAHWPDFHSVLTGLLSLNSQHRLIVFNDVIVFYPGRIAPAMFEYARLNGVDWLAITDLLRRQRERRSRRFPSANFFRHLARKITGTRNHAAS